MTLQQYVTKIQKMSLDVAAKLTSFGVLQNIQNAELSQKLGKRIENGETFDSIHETAGILNFYTR